MVRKISELSFEELVAVAESTAAERDGLRTQLAETQAEVERMRIGDSRLRSEREIVRQRCRSLENQVRYLNDEATAATARAEAAEADAATWKHQAGKLEEQLIEKDELLTESNAEQVRQRQRADELAALVEVRTKALEKVTDAAKSYRSDILGHTVEKPAEYCPELSYAPKYPGRDGSIREAESSLATTPAAALGRFKAKVLRVKAAALRKAAKELTPSTSEWTGGDHERGFATGKQWCADVLTAKSVRLKREAQSGN